MGGFGDRCLGHSANPLRTKRRCEKWQVVRESNSHGWFWRPEPKPLGQRPVGETGAAKQWQRMRESNSPGRLWRPLPSQSANPLRTRNSTDGSFASDLQNRRQQKSPSRGFSSESQTADHRSIAVVFLMASARDKRQRAPTPKRRGCDIDHRELAAHDRLQKIRLRLE